MKLAPLQRLLSSAVLLFPVVAGALEFPSEKLGLWEIRVQDSTDGGPLTAPLTMQYCLNAALLATAKKSAQEKSKNCSKNEVRNEGSKWIHNSVCKVGSSTATAQMTREFNGDSAYHDDANGTYDPPLALSMGGGSRSRQVKDGKWLGPCK